MDSLKITALNGDRTWIANPDMKLSPFCSMLARMHWGAAWHAFSCALVDSSLVGEFEPLLRDLFAGISAFRGGMFDSDTAFFWNELESEINFVTAEGADSPRALDQFFSLLERRPDLIPLIKKCEVKGLPDPESGSALNFTGDLIFCLARSGPAAIARAGALGLLPRQDYEADWLRALSMDSDLQTPEILKTVFAPPLAGDLPPLPREIVEWTTGKGRSSKLALTDWALDIIKESPPLARIVFDWVGNDVLAGSPAKAWLSAPPSFSSNPLSIDVQAARHASVIGMLWERGAFRSQSVSAGLAAARKLGRVHPAVESIVEAILITAAATPPKAASQSRKSRL